MLAKDWNSLLGTVKRQMGLTMPLRLALVNSGSPPGVTENTPAWVQRPIPMPIFGTREFNRTQVTIYIRKSYLAEAPAGAVIVAAAHELAHIVLDSLDHPLRETEEAVDLTAMLLGYQCFFVQDKYYEGVTRLHAKTKLGEALAGLTDELHSLIREKSRANADIACPGYLTPEERRYAATLLRR